MKYLITISFFLVLISQKISAQSFTEFVCQDIEGNEIRLSSYLDKGPVMIGFWRSWCSSCKEEQRCMRVIYEKYKSEGFTYIGINIDNQKSVSKVKSYITSMGFTFPVVLDTDKKIFEMYNGSEDAVPYYLIIGKDKNILHSHLGFKTGDELIIETEIKEALGISE